MVTAAITQNLGTMLGDLSFSVSALHHRVFMSVACWLQWAGAKGYTLALV